MAPVTRAADGLLSCALPPCAHYQGLMLQHKDKSTEERYPRGTDKGPGPDSHWEAPLCWPQRG